MDEERRRSPRHREDLEVIRTDADILTVRFRAVIGVPERTWRCHRAAPGGPVKGPWPHPARDGVRDAASCAGLPGLGSPQGLSELPL